jgi:hypothetical protein
MICARRKKGRAVERGGRYFVAVNGGNIQLEKAM